MNRLNPFWRFVTVAILIILVLIATIGVLFWKALTPHEQSLLTDTFGKQFLYVFGILFLILAGLGFILDAIFHLYILPLNKLIEETQIIHSVNAAHRIKPEGSRDILRLAQMINEDAERREILLKDIERKLHAVALESENEKNIFAAFIEELPEGVLICNRDGQILLYNRRAKEQLSREENKNGDLHTGGFVGLGRSVFGLIDKPLIVHVMEEINEKLSTKTDFPTATFVMSNRDENFLRVQAVPILDSQQAFDGFILIFFDFSPHLETGNRLNYIIQTLGMGIRTSLTSIRSAVEALIEYENMDNRQRDRFRDIIHKEAIMIGKLLDRSLSNLPETPSAQWPRFRMPVVSLLKGLQKRAEKKMGIELILDTDFPADICVKVDSYSWGLTISFLLQKLATHNNVNQFRMLPQTREKFIELDIQWKGAALKLETLKEWKADPVWVSGEASPLSLQEIMGYHEAELWPKYDPEEGTGHLVISMMQMEDREPDNLNRISIFPKSRPEFYDFDLFNQPGQTPELDDRPLNELTYTVFDTETTGLNPEAGDEILSIGAVRIVNLRLLRGETFDQLIDPQRSIPPESTKIHGIEPEMVQGKPTIEEILPLFEKFVSDTIIVAHNAAFDMKMLQLKEPSTGVRFVNPVLDTMLLSAVVQPAQRAHSIEEVARRFGISIVGRHTALGDAIVTGEIFLKLLPLLRQSGIHTLKGGHQCIPKNLLRKVEILKEVEWVKP